MQAPVPTARVADHKPHQSHSASWEHSGTRRPGLERPSCPPRRVSVLLFVCVCVRVCVILKCWKYKSAEMQAALPLPLLLLLRWWNAEAPRTSSLPSSSPAPPSLSPPDSLVSWALCCLSGDPLPPDEKLGLAPLSSAAVFSNRPSFSDKSQAEERQRSLLRISETDKNQSERTDSSPKSRARECERAQREHGTVLF